MHKNTWGFTLMELVVVIAMLWILSTLAFLYLAWNIKDTRNGKRISELKNIEKNLNIFSTKKWQYPVPDTPVNITYSGATVWTQWTFWENVNRNLGVFSKDFPKDPLFEAEYTYSTTNHGREFQIATILENSRWELSFQRIIPSPIPQVLASWKVKAFVIGDYNGYMAHTLYNGKDYFIATPSIIASDISNLDILAIIANKKLVFDRRFNIPSSYTWVSSLSDGGFDFDVSNPVIFGEKINIVMNSTQLLTIDTKVKSVYSATSLKLLDRYKALINSSGTNKIKNVLKGKFKIIF